MAPTASKTEQAVAEWLRESAQVQTRTAESQAAAIARAAEAMGKALCAGRKIIWFGNGGSATQSQHMAAEFVGRFCKDRRSLPSMSLTENMASVTAIANDYDYQRIFSRQLEGLSQPGDVAVGISTSGNSPNVLAALRRAKELGLTAIGLTGSGGGAMRQACDVCIEVASTTTARIQEAHLTVGHILCALTEETVLAAGSSKS